MTYSLLKAIWTGLLPVSFFFMFLDFRIRVDRSYRYFGLALLFLCAMTGIDLWILPEASRPGSQMLWQSLMFIVGCLFAVFYFWYMAELLAIRHPLLQRILAAWAACLCLGFAAGLMFRADADSGGIVRTRLYDFTFPPFMSLCLFGALYLILRKWRRASKPERRALSLHLLGFLMLFTFGVLDVAFTYYFPKPFFVSFNTLGALAFGVSMSLIFVEHFLSLMAERSAMQKQVVEALHELEQARPMKRVGESLSLLLHEIKNQVAVITGNITLMDRKSIPGDFRGELERIHRAAHGLDRMSRGVLDIPALFVPGERKEFDLRDLLAGCIRDGLPPDQQAKMALEVGGGVVAFGDPAKLSQAFHNLLKNAAESGAGRVWIRCRSCAGARVVAIEDDGAGCDAARLGEIGRAFHTTKRAAGGAGLGVCVAGAILENHGGSLSFYSKNLLGASATGLVVNAVLPGDPRFEAARPPDESAGKALILARDAGLRERMGAIARNLVHLSLACEDVEDLAGADLNRPVKLLIERDLWAGIGPGLRNSLPWALVSTAPGWAEIRAHGSKVDEGILSEYLMAGWP